MAHYIVIYLIAPVAVVLGIYLICGFSVARAHSRTEEADKRRYAVPAAKKAEHANV